MILTVTPNPALDVSGTVDQIVPNEKNYVQGELRQAGGNGINVARVLTRLRAPVLATGFLGGSAGAEISKLLHSESVTHEFVPIQGNTRISVTVSNRTTGKQTRLSFPGPEILAREASELLHLVLSSSAISLVVIGGSLPSGFGAKHVSKLIRLLKRRNIKTAVDIPAKFLRTAVAAEPILIKPNLSEFQQLMRTTVRSVPEVLEKSRQLLSRVPMVCVSSVEGGALLVTRDGAWFGRGPRVKVRSTVGAGDSMVAGICSRLAGRESLRWDAPDLLRWGLACAMATVSTPGTSFGSAKEMKHLYGRIAIREVKS